MDFTVYSYGGAEMLWKSFNSMAMLANSDYFHKLSVLTMGVALLTVAARALPAASFPFLFRKWVMPTFLLLVFFWGPKVTVNLVDNIDINFRAAQVTNVPFGIAFSASFSSKISQVLTEAVEKYMTTSDVERYSQVGPMFGARLMYEARTLTIKDPIMRENLKDFTRQCFAWPYVFTNIHPGKKAAMETQDILGFIEANAHKSLGMYWRKPGGESEFMFCGKCAAKVREVIPLEVETGFSALANRLFGSNSDGLAETTRLKQYFGDAWQRLAKGSSDAANIIQQELMLNSYRAALQDKREEFGLPRNPALSYLNAERGQIQQDESSLVKLALSGTQVPMWHAFFFCFGILFFAAIAPFTFVNGGYHMILTFAKFMLWLTTWPPLAELINALGHMYLAKATSGQLMGYGDGLNLMTQNGLADTAYHAYTFVMGLQLLVPPIAWALLSNGGSYAMSQLSGYMTQPGESFASKAGSEVVDGNVTFDSQTLHHRSVANTQMAQQQLSPNMNYGSRFDDGKLATLYGPAVNGELDRNPTFQEHQTQMGTNIAHNDALSAMMGWRSEEAYTSGISNSKMAGKQVQSGMNETFGMLKHLNTTKGFTDTFGSNASTSIQKSLSDTMDFVKQVAKDHNVGVDKAFEMFAGVAASLGLSFGAGKGGSGLGASIGIGGNLGGQYKVTASDREALSEHIKSGKIQQVANSLGSVFQHLEDNKGSISDSLTTQKMNQVQWHFNEGQHYSDQAAVNFSAAKTFAESASAQRQRGISSNTNLTDQGVHALADQKYGGDLLRAAQEASQNPEALKQMASRQIDLSELKTRSTGFEQDIKQDYAMNRDKIENAPSYNAEVAQGRNELGAKTDELEEKINETQRKTKQEMAQQQSKIMPKQQELEDKYNQIEGELNKEAEKGLIKKTWNKVVK